ncbi:MAG: CopG family transcriptional regulator [Desmonostoc vinosum HA7617-LM4]|nr:CopG family transcriptional regulator [Desmonostoc vinosum HA7617-LM4]
MTKFTESTTTGKKFATQQITVSLTLDEAQSLDNYCQQTGKAAIDVIQELIRKLPVA